MEEAIFLQEVIVCRSNNDKSSSNNDVSNISCRCLVILSLKLVIEKEKCQK